MKMIKLNTDRYVVVTDSEIKEGDWYVHNQKGVGLRVQQCVGTNLPMDSKKITHSTQPLECDKMWTPVNGKQWMCNTMLCCGKIINLKTNPISLQEIKALLGEVDVEKKMISPYPINTQNDVDWCNGYQRGYTQALEDNKEKKYTEEDMKKAWNAAYIDAMSIDEETYKPLFFQDFIQSLQPKTEWEVEFDDNGKLRLKK